MNDQWRCMIGHVERGEELCAGCVALRNSTIDDILDRVEERGSEREMPAVDGEAVKAWPCDNDINCEFCEGAGYLDAVMNGEEDWA